VDAGGVRSVLGAAFQIDSLHLSDAPCLSLLIGLLWSRAISGKECESFRRYSIWAVAAAIVMGTAMLFSQRLPHKPIPGLSPVLTTMALTLIAGTSAALALVWTKRWSWAFATLCAGAAAFVAVAVSFGLPVATRSISDPMVAAASCIARHSSEGDCVLAYQLNRDPPELAFYSQRIVMDASSPEDIARALASGKRVIVVAAVMRPEGLPASMKLKARSGRYLLYADR